LVTSRATWCATVASAAPSPSPLPVPSPSPGTVQCTVDKEVGGITGLTATANGYAVTVKATSGLALRVYLLDAECRRSGKSLAYNADGGARHVTAEQTGTENKLSKIGMTRVTGAANSHDGKHVAIRTYSDAYEWGVTNGDVVGAITRGTPKITPLPNEPQGSAIAYSRDN